MKSLLMFFGLFLAVSGLRAQAVLGDGMYDLLDADGKKFKFEVEDTKGTLTYPDPKPDGCSFELVRKAMDPKTPNTFVFIEPRDRVTSAACTETQKNAKPLEVSFTVEPTIKCAVRSNGKMRPPQRVTTSGSSN